MLHLRRIMNAGFSSSKRGYIMWEVQHWDLFDGTSKGSDVVRCYTCYKKV